MLSLGTELQNPADRAYEGFGDDEIPPVDSCAHCGQGSCQGECRVVKASRARAATGGVLERSLAVTLAPREQFGRALPDAPWESLRFAFLSEFLAVASFALPLTAVVLALDETWGERLATFGTASIATLLITFIVVLLHFLWGASLELGLWLSGRRSDASLGMSFSGYTCGFDLLTSPLGLAWLLGRQDVAVLAALRSAVAAPRPAMQAYLSEARHLDPASIRAAERGAWVGFALGIVALILGAAYGTWTILLGELGV